MQPGVYLGLMSGTSMDGIDAALVRLDSHRCEVLHAETCRYDDALRSSLFAASRNPQHFTVDQVGQLDQRVALAFLKAAREVLAASGTNTEDVVAIGSHGQTVRHQPRCKPAFTMQLGDPNVIANGTGITTVADFRRADLALGGEGAPLAPAFHRWAFTANSARIVLNIGGFANITVLPANDEAVSGCDTGPGNTLLDWWCERHTGRAYDDDGGWAAGGSFDEQLLQALLADPYFALPGPKSTGFEYFHSAWLEERLAKQRTLAPVDVQASLAELTARSIADAIAHSAPHAAEILVCGGGVHNSDLLRRLRSSLPQASVVSTADFGIDPDWIEAAAFAWLAARRLADLPGNLPAVTGASRPAILGGIYSGRS